MSIKYLANLSNPNTRLHGLMRTILDCMKDFGLLSWSFVEDNTCELLEVCKLSWKCMAFYYEFNVIRDII